MAMTHLSSILEAGRRVKGEAAAVGVSTTYMDPEVVGTMGMSSASMGMDQGMWKWGANSLITRFLKGQTVGLYCNRSTGGQRARLHPPQNLGTVVVVLHGILHEAETVDVTDVGVTVGSQEVEAAHRLLGITQTLAERTNQESALEEPGICSGK